jgi:hypothetical protein
MKCQDCNSETKINWGDANIVLCEAHSNELEKFKNESLVSTKKETNIIGISLRILLVVICWTLAALSLTFVGLSAMAFDSGFSWTGAIIFGIFSLIPLSLFITPMYVLFKK